jgi:iron complex transport system substrate-binding protein
MSTSPRIVSLLPSATEIVCAIGLEHSLVGISHECDYPASITDRPRLTVPKIDIHANSHRIDREVRSLVSKGLSIYTIDTDQLRLLQPELIITQDQCEVCAVPYRDVVNATQQVLGSPLDVLSLHPAMLRDIWSDIRRVGAATGHASQADGLLEALFDRVTTILSVSATLKVPPRVAVIEWIEPLILAGNWMPELIQIAGGHDGLCQMGKHSQPAEWGMLQNYAPDILLIIPCGFKLEQTLEQLPILQNLPGWKQLPAVRQRRAYAVDGNAYFNRPGPRIVDSLEILAGLIYPDLFGAYLADHKQSFQRLE